jgi:hypothetical protein
VFPSLTYLFPDSDYYVGGADIFPSNKKDAYRFSSIDPSGYLSVSFLERYNLECATEFKKEYDKLFLVIDLAWLGEVHSVQTLEHFKNIASKLEGVSYKKLIIIDYGDSFLCSKGLNHLEKVLNRKVDGVFKRNYGKTNLEDYSNKIFPFPYLVFPSQDSSERLDPSWTLYKEPLNPSLEELWNRKNSIFFGSGTHSNRPHRHAERHPVWLSVIEQDFVSCRGGMTIRNYLEDCGRYRFFLHANGCGDLCRNFFEGLSRGGLMLQEEMNVVFPFENEDNFAKGTIFSNIEEFKNGWHKFQDRGSYEDAIAQQNYIVKKYYSKEWIVRYIEERI